MHPRQMPESEARSLRTRARTESSTKVHSVAPGEGSIDPGEPRKEIGVLERVRASLRSRLAQMATLVASLALCVLIVVAAWPARGPAPHEAVGQELTVPAATAPSVSPPTATAPALFPGLTDEFVSAQPEPEGIPGLGMMDVIGHLRHFRVEGGFVCNGPTPTEGSGTVWVCSAPEGKLPGIYELTILGEDPLTVLWVKATVRGVSEEQAAKFFSYVASLCLQDTDPLNPEAWVEQNVVPGGQVFAQGAELTIYGTKEERTLQVVATDLL